MRVPLPVIQSQSDFMAYWPPLPFYVHASTPFLPMSVLAEIFQYAIQPDFVFDRRSSRYNWSYLKALAMVCKQWHELVRSIPQLWTYVSPMKVSNLAVFEGNLKLSGNLPLDLLLPMKSVTLDVLRILATESWRVRRLAAAVSSPSDDLCILQSGLADFDAFSVQQLLIFTEGQSPGSGHVAPSLLPIFQAPSVAPMLQHLHLCDVSMWPEDLSSGLISFSLSRKHFEYSETTMEQILRLFDANQSTLCTVRLSEAFDPVTSRIALATPAWMYSIHLQNLSEISFTEDENIIKYLLSPLILPRNATLYLRTTTDLSSTETPFASIFPSTELNFLGPLRAVSNLRVCIRGLDSLVIQGFDDRGKRSVDVEVSNYSDLAHLVTANDIGKWIAQLPLVLPFAQIRELTLDLSHNPPVMEKAVWCTFFTALSDLRILVVLGAPTPALLESLVPTNELLLTRLHTLVFKIDLNDGLPNAGISVPVLTSLRTMVGARAIVGLPVQKMKFMLGIPRHQQFFYPSGFLVTISQLCAFVGGRRVSAETYFV